MPRSSLISLFADFERYATDVAVVQRRGYRRERWTYAQLARAASSFAKLLQKRGVRTGERVILWGPNSAEWMAAFWGCLLRGAVAVPLDDGATAEFAARVAHETDAKLAVAARGKPGLGAVSTLDLEDLADTSKYPVTPKSEGTRETFSDEPITRNHIAQILFTSGTTAEPRGVVLTHGNFLANLEPLEGGIDPYRRYEKWFHPLRFVTLVPLSHVFGQFMALFVPQLLGATIVFEVSANPAEIIRTTRRERATALIAVPRMLNGLRAGFLRELDARGQSEWFHHAFASADGRTFLRRAWRFRRIHRQFGWKFWAFISGGAALSSETEEFFRRMGYAVVQGYGMTETASLISLNHPFRAAQGTIGKVLPGREFRLAEDGEILVRGENVTGGYWEAGGFRSSDGSAWLRTGDVGELDAEGNLRFRGRKKNVIVTSAGLNVYPEDLERAVRRQAGVRDCVVVPVERGGNAEPCAVLLINAGGGEGVPEVAGLAIESANVSLAEYQRMRLWVVWPDADFPRTATGKPRLAIITASAREILMDARDANADGAGSVAAASRPGKLGRSGASPLQTASSDLENLLAKFAKAGGVIPQELKPSGGEGAMSKLELRAPSLSPTPKLEFRLPTPSAHIEDELNLSSLDRVELMSALEERYQVELSETAFAQAKTLGDVERLLREPSVHRAEYVYPRWALSGPVRWLRLVVYYALVWPATQILGHPKIVGRDNLRGLRGPLLVVSNHITRRADIGLILVALPARFRNRLATAMGGETLRQMRQPPSEWLFARRWAYQLGYWLVTALFNVFPLPQQSGFRESFRYAGECIDQGYSVLVFPEGEVNDSETGAMTEFRSGIGLLTENLNVPVVPMRLDGVWKMKRERRRLARLGEITVRIGAPVTFPAGTSADEILRLLEACVRSL